MNPLVEILSDGKTVWVNVPDGCIGRFSRFGIDVHQSFAVQMATGQQCLDCTHKRPDAAAWERFKTGMQQHHRVEVGDEHRPQWLPNP